MEDEWCKKRWNVDASATSGDDARGFSDARQTSALVVAAAVADAANHHALAAVHSPARSPAPEMRATATNGNGEKGANRRLHRSERTAVRELHVDVSADRVTIVSWSLATMSVCCQRLSSLIRNFESVGVSANKHQQT